MTKKPILGNLIGRRLRLEKMPGNKKKTNSPFPLKLLKPIQKFLGQEEKKLTKRKKELERQDPYLNTERLNDNAAIDTDAAEEAGHERIFALKKEIDRTLIRIRKTMTRIKLDKYGICESCGKMIDTDRLAINPTSSFCIKCKKNQS